jgi:hypothetical protein
MLSSRNIYIWKALKKLTDKFLNLFWVITIQGKNVYKLKLPKSYRRIHRTFHVTLLKLYQRREGVKLSKVVKIEDKAK